MSLFVDVPIPEGKAGVIFAIRFQDDPSGIGSGVAVFENTPETVEDEKELVLEIVEKARVKSGHGEGAFSIVAMAIVHGGTIRFLDVDRLVAELQKDGVAALVDMSQKHIA